MARTIPTSTRSNSHTLLVADIGLSAHLLGLLCSRCLFLVRGEVSSSLVFAVAGCRGRNSNSGKDRYILADTFLKITPAPENPTTTHIHILAMNYGSYISSSFNPRRTSHRDPPNLPCN